MVVAISIDTYCFFAFSNLTFHLEDDTGIGVFWLLCLKKKLQTSDQEASPTASKHTGLVFSGMLCLKVRTYSYFQWCRYSRGTWLPLVTTNVFLRESPPPWTYFKNQCLMAFTVYFSDLCLFLALMKWLYQKYKKKIPLTHRIL